MTRYLSRRSPARHLAHPHAHPRRSLAVLSAFACGVSLLVTPLLTQARAEIPIAPAVTTQPDVQLYTGATTNLEFSAAAYGVPLPTEQWESAPGREGPWTAIPGATGTTLDVTFGPDTEGHAYRAVFTNASGSTTSRPAKVVSTENWMQDLGDDIGNVPITELTIPGTHDMGTYRMPPAFAASAALDGLSGPCDTYHIPWEVCDSFARAQDFDDATHELNDGMRYFDLRVCGNSSAATSAPPDLVAVSQDPVTCHGFEAAHLHDILTQTSTWAAAHPDEVVILDVNHEFDIDLNTLAGQIVKAFTRADGTSLLLPPPYCAPRDPSSGTCAGNLTLNNIRARRQTAEGGQLLHQNVIVNVENDGSPNKVCLPFGGGCWDYRPAPDATFYDTYKQLWGRPVTAPVNMARCTVSGAFASCFGNESHNIDVLDAVVADTHTRQSFAEPHPAYTFEHLYVQFLQTTPDFPYMAQNPSSSLKDMALDDNSVIAPDIIGATDGSWENCKVVRLPGIGGLMPDPTRVPDCFGAHQPENVNILALNFYNRTPNGRNFNLVHEVIKFDEYARTAPVVRVLSYVSPSSTGWYNAASVGGQGNPLAISVEVSDYRYPTGLDALNCTDNGTAIAANLSGGVTLPTVNTSATGNAMLTDGLHAVHCAATDGADQGTHGQGNQGAGPGSVPDATFRVDTTPPTVQCPTGAQVVVDDPNGRISGTVSDGLSGPLSGVATSAVPDSQLGTFAAPLTGSDVAGNTTTVNCSYEVIKATPTISTVPSASVPAGGHIADTATVSSVAHPSGTVTFSEYAPGDTQCTTPLATTTAALSSGTASSSSIQATRIGTYNWVASYSGDAKNNPVAGTCGQEQVVITPQVLIGRAYGVSIAATASGKPLLTVKPTPDTGQVSTTASSTTGPPCLQAIPGITVRAICVGVVTDANYPANSAATASIATMTISLAKIPVVTLRTVVATSTTSCAGSSGNVTIGYLKVGSTVVIGKPTAVRPNTVIKVGVVTLVLNEHVASPSPARGLTVNAIHLSVNASDGAVVNAVAASTQSGISNCP